MIRVTEKHPFLVKMVDGTLAMEPFIYYVIQDALYLVDFADCLDRLSENPEVKDTDQSKRLKAFATGAREAEMSLHSSFFKKWNINAQNAKAMPNTLLYTSYLLRTVSTRDHAEGMASLLPCFWVYMHVGKCMLKLREELGDQVKRCPQFDEWIDMYGGDEFEKEVTDYIEMVDDVASKVSAEKVELMKEHFLMCCKLEHMFWDQAMDQMDWPSELNDE